MKSQVMKLIDVHMGEHYETAKWGWDAAAKKKKKALTSTRLRTALALPTRIPSKLLLARLAR